MSILEGSTGSAEVARTAPMATISQIAVVVRDIEKTMRDYTERLGWGPWSVFDYGPPLLHDTMLRGEPTDFAMIGAEVDVAGLGFELVQPTSGASIYQEHLDSFGEGVQHIACMQHSIEDSDALKADWSAAGHDVVMSGRIGDSIEFYYIDTAPLLKFVMESGSGHAIDLIPSRYCPPVDTP